MRNEGEESEALPTIQSRGVPCDDLTVGQSQEALVNSRLVQLWQTYEIARFIRFLWVVHQGLYYDFDLGAQRMVGPTKL